MPEAALLGVDWGSTRVRVHAFDSGGNVFASRTSNAGMATLPNPEAFANVLAGLLDPLSDNGETPVLLAGMAGARGGWRETPYVQAPSDAATIAAGLMPLEFGQRRAAIVPGVCGIPEEGFADVMRGEETQVLGLSNAYTRVVAPGTHSKWIGLDEGRIARLRTAPTGEVYALLMQHSLIGQGLPVDAWSEAAFTDGVEAARRHPDWLHQLFGVRARRVRNMASPEALPAFLSGLLVGYECVSALAREPAVGETIAVVGGGALPQRYAAALDAMGAIPDIIDGDQAFCRGLWRIASHAGFA